jgi:defect-in-organelle-trafficking protein DotA
VISINLVGTMLVYTYVMMSVLDQAYSLIYQIPDRILRWIGGPADSPGAGAAQAAREVKQQTQSAGSQAGQGAGQSMRAPSIPVDSSAGSGNAKDLYQAFKENNKKDDPSSINKNSNGNAPGS